MRFFIFQKLEPETLPTETLTRNTAFYCCTCNWNLGSAAYLLTLTTANGKRHTVRLIKQSNPFSR